MPNSLEELQSLRAEIYRCQQQVVALNRAAALHEDPAVRSAIVEAEKCLLQAERKLQQAQQDAAEAAARAETPQVEKARTRGSDTTGLNIELKPLMSHIPTGIYHLLDCDADPLVECVIKASRSRTGTYTPKRRVRVTAYIDGYSANAVKTVEVPNDSVSEPIHLLPTLFPERIGTVYELTRATLNVLVEDLDTQKVEDHRTLEVWLLARNAATFAIQNPTTGTVKDLRYLLGAYVTPNHPRIQHFLHEVALQRDDRRLPGVLDNASSQAAAIFEALRAKAGITYVNATLAFNPTLGAQGQRVRLPHETLEAQQANCLDGTLLFASLLEALGLEPAIVLVRGHALAGWRTGPGENDWSYLETTMIGDATKSFDEAQRAGIDTAVMYMNLQADSESPADSYFLRMALSDLRVQHNVTPLT